MRHTLHELGLKHGTNKADDAQLYLDFYEGYFGHLRDEKINLLEIGYNYGASIRMWLDYFENANIYAIDIKRPKRVGMTHERMFLTQMYQTNEKLRELYPDDFFSIILDDGSHFQYHQQKSLEMLWPKLKSGGYYVIEDLYCSFIRKYRDSEVSTYNWLIKKGNVPPIDHIHDETELIEIWFRDQKDMYKCASTALIEKK